MTLPTLPTLLAPDAPPLASTAPVIAGADLRFGFTTPGAIDAQRAEAAPAMAMSSYEITLQEFDAARLNHPSHGLRMALIEGPHASEQLLAPETMRRVQALLGAERLVACVPARGQLLAADAALSEARFAPVLRSADRRFREGKEPLSARWFTLKDGALTGALPERPVPPAPASAESGPGKTARVKVSGSDVDAVASVFLEKFTPVATQMTGRLDLQFELSCHLELLIRDWSAELRAAAATLEGPGRAQFGVIRVVGSAAPRTGELAGLAAHQVYAIAFAPYAVYLLGGSGTDRMMELVTALMATRSPVLSEATRYMGAEPGEMLGRFLHYGRTPDEALRAARFAMQLGLPKDKAAETAEGIAQVAKRVAKGREKDVARALGF